MSEQITASEARQRLAAKMANLKNGNELANFGTRQPNPEEHLFSQGDYEKFKLISPPYDPTKLKRIVDIEIIMLSFEELKFLPKEVMKDAKDAGFSDR